MELAPYGELFQVLRAEGRLNDSLSAHTAAQVASGLAYLHRLQVTHRNLKPEVVLIGADALVKIASFA